MSNETQPKLLSSDPNVAEKQVADLLRSRGIERFDDPRSAIEVGLALGILVVRDAEAAPPTSDAVETGE